MLFQLGKMVRCGFKSVRCFSKLDHWWWASSIKVEMLARLDWRAVVRTPSINRAPNTLLEALEKCCFFIGANVL